MEPTSQMENLAAHLAATRAANPDIVFWGGPMPADDRAEELRQTMSQLNSEIQGIKSRADRNARDFTAAENAELDDLIAKFDAADAALSEIDPEFKAVRLRGRKTDPNDVVRGSLGRQPTEREIKLSPVAPGIAGRTYAELFGDRRAQASDLPAMDFVRAVAQGRYDPRLIRAQQGEDTGMGGGYLVPTMIVKAVWDLMLSSSLVLSRARIFPSSSNSLYVPHPDIANRSTDIAGLQGRWIAEHGEFTATDTAKIIGTLYRLAKIGTLLKISNEWLEDVPAENASIFNELLAGVLVYDLDASFFLGTGAGMPMGLLTAPSAITVSKESAQGSDTVLYANVLNMWSRLHPQCQTNAVWYCSPSVQPQLAQMAFDPAADNKIPVYLPANGAAGQPFATLMGKPLIPTEFQPHVGDLGDLILVDMSKYGIAWKNGLVLDKSEHRYFENDQIGLRAKIRADAGPLWASEHTPRGDTAHTMSWAVKLQAR